MCNALVASLSQRIGKLPVQIVICPDDKQMSIGAKRQWLLDNCETPHFVMLDDDDDLSSDYFELVIPALKENPDCVTYLEAIIRDGAQTGIARHSNDYKKWMWQHHHNGVSYLAGRTPFYKDILKTEIAQKIGFKDMRYGEDADFSNRLKSSKLINTEVHIPKCMYLYNYPTLTAKEHNKRYGIY